MLKQIAEKMHEALILKYKAEIAEAKTTIHIYLTRPVGIGEHPQHLEEMDKLLDKIASAEDKIDVLQRHFNDYAKI
jgi:ribosomal protein S3